MQYVAAFAYNVACFGCILRHR